MRRREFITLVGGAAATWPLPARAQQAAIPRIGYVFVGVSGGTDVSNAGLRQGLADRGYEIGRNLILASTMRGASIWARPTRSDDLALELDLAPTTAGCSHLATYIPITMVGWSPIAINLDNCCSRR
jgi:putative ABC transport system substrate-binding protein